MGLIYLLLAIFSLGGVALALIARAVRRFERRQRALGQWDEYGPLVETDVPTAGTRGQAMEWKAAANGARTTRVVRLRKPHERP